MEARNEEGTRHHGHSSGADQRRRDRHLGALTAYAGQQAGLHRCAKLSPAAARAVADPAYGASLADLARCPR